MNIKISKRKRKDWFKQPYDLVYDNFVKLGYDTVSKDFLKIKEVVENLRKFLENFNH